ncbi:MAG: hypothetical protein AAGG48_31130 [Planctomycetota bacterium]
MRPLGHVLMWGGFLAASFVSLSQVEPSAVVDPTVPPEEQEVVEVNKWATINWPLYAATMAVGVVGIVILRATRQQLEGDEETQEAEYSVLQDRLQVIQEAVNEMAGQSSYDPAEILHRIDDQCAEPLADFADARKSLIRRYGMSVYAEVMTEFASAERYINRCWSAAADGYVDEVRDCLQRAKHHLGKTSELIVAADQIA